MNPSNQTLICTILKENASGWYRRAANFSAQGDSDGAFECKTVARMLAKQADYIANKYNDNGGERYSVRGKYRPRKTTLTKGQFYGRANTDKMG